MTARPTRSKKPSRPFWLNASNWPIRGRWSFCNKKNTTAASSEGSTACAKCGSVILWPWNLEGCLNVFEEGTHTNTHMHTHTHRTTTHVSHTSIQDQRVSTKVRLTKGIRVTPAGAACNPGRPRAPIGCRNGPQKHPSPWRWLSPQRADTSTRRKNRWYSRSESCRGPWPRRRVPVGGRWGAFGPTLKA